MAKLDHILYKAYLTIFGKRKFPAVIGEEAVHIDYDTDKHHKGHKGNDIFRGSI